jgi:hypothetical protein
LLPLSAVVQPVAITCPSSGRLSLSLAIAGRPAVALRPRSALPPAGTDACGSVADELVTGLAGDMPAGADCGSGVGTISG